MAKTASQYKSNKKQQYSLDWMFVGALELKQASFVEVPDLALCAKSELAVHTE